MRANLGPIQSQTACPETGWFWDAEAAVSLLIS